MKKTRRRFSREFKLEAVRQLTAGRRLADVAPTLLDLIGLQQPPAMTGHSLIHLEERRAAE